MKKILEYIKSFCKWVRTDGLLHITCSALVLLFFCALMPPFCAIMLTLALGVAKEAFWDNMLGHGVSEVHDLECDIIGIILGLLLYIII